MAQTHDIEDVLSSIRRLVANEPGTARTPPPDGPTLVLDASQRVTEPEDPFQMIRTLAQEERDGRDAEHLTDALPDDVAAITGDLVNLSDDDVQTPDAGRTVIWADDETPPEAVDPIAFVHTKSAVEAQVEDGSATVDLSDDYAEDTDYEAEMPTDASPVERDMDIASPETEANTAPDRDALADLSSALNGDDALRDLISEIVRQELSGELGERITRNVRKLVRREIRQLLASEEFD
tara:strand:+ start:829 stop:1539 length:711 start_codon:yes stop_codon:yes gene_type:complete